MTQLEKCEALTEWLDLHHIEWHSPKKEHVYPQGIQFIIRKPHIHVIACQPLQEDGAFNVAKQRYAKAFFIREGETTEYIIHKMRNALKGWTSAQALRKEAEAPEARRKAGKVTGSMPKRRRMHFQKVKGTRKATV